MLISVLQTLYLCFIFSKKPQLLSTNEISCLRLARCDCWPMVALVSLHCVRLPTVTVRLQCAVQWGGSVAQVGSAAAARRLRRIFWDWTCAPGVLSTGNMRLRCLSYLSGSRGLAIRLGGHSFLSSIYSYNIVFPNRAQLSSRIPRDVFIFVMISEFTDLNQDA